MFFVQFDEYSTSFRLLFQMMYANAHRTAISYGYNFECIASEDDNTHRRHCLPEQSNGCEQMVYISRKKKFILTSNNKKNEKNLPS